MQANIHFISGLPRSGSTLLSAILRQNPRFHAGMTGPVGSLVDAMLRSMSMNNETAIFISDAQRRAILGLVNDWDSKDYDLTKDQCVDFVSAIARAAGLKVPPRDRLDFPVDLVAKLKKLNP